MEITTSTRFADRGSNALPVTEPERDDDSIEEDHHE
jgi:hypothetical protein